MVPIVLLFFILAMDSARMDAPTMDEQNHLTRGLTLLKTGDPRFSLEHPPVVNVLSALPVYALTDVVIPTNLPNWQWERDGWYGVAESLLWEVNSNPDLLIFLARLPIIFLTILLALIAMRFAREFWGDAYGRWAGLAAASLLLFDPNILAHGRFTTTDLGGAAFLLLAFWQLWRLWRMDGWRSKQLTVTTLAIGLAFGSKMSNLAIAPIFIVLALLPLYGSSFTIREGSRRLVQLAIAGLGGLFVVWMWYGFEWRQFYFLSDQLRALNSHSGPMPTFFAGIEQITFLSGGGRASYLLGEFSSEGFFWYFPIAFLVKTPLPVLVLTPIGLVFLIRRRIFRRRLSFLLLPCMYYALLSLNSALNIGYRHLIPLLPLLYVMLSGALAMWLTTALKHRHAYLRRGFAATILATLLLTTLIIHPHYVSFFNKIAGGPREGWKVLIDSNIDWGQDLKRLGLWLETRQDPALYLSYFGSADPAAYQIDYEPLPGFPRHFDLWWDPPFEPQNPPPGLYAISVSNLGEPPLQTDEKVVFAYFRQREPDYRIGYSINIYEVR